MKQSAKMGVPGPLYEKFHKKKRMLGFPKEAYISTNMINMESRKDLQQPILWI